MKNAIKNFLTQADVLKRKGNGVTIFAIVIFIIISGGIGALIWYILSNFKDVPLPIIFGLYSLLGVFLLIAVLYLIKLFTDTSGEVYYEASNEAWKKLYQESFDDVKPNSNIKVVDIIDSQDFFIPGINIESKAAIPTKSIIFDFNSQLFEFNISNKFGRQKAGDVAMTILSVIGSILTRSNGANRSETMSKYVYLRAKDKDVNTTHPIVIYNSKYKKSGNVETESIAFGKKYTIKGSSEQDAEAIKLLKPKAIDQLNNIDLPNDCLGFSASNDQGYVIHLLDKGKKYGSDRIGIYETAFSRSSNKKRMEKNLTTQVNLIIDSLNYLNALIN